MWRIAMRKLQLLLAIVFILIPLLLSGQLKKDADNKINISNVLSSSLLNKSYLGILDPSKLKMSHAISMSYLSLGGYGAMVNTYINTIHYQFSDKLLLTTKLGIMNSPYNSFPNSSFLNNGQFFGGAQLKYSPSEHSALYFSIESNPYLYSGESLFYQRTPFSILNQ
jgi:hypothetical protein